LERHRTGGMTAIAVLTIIFGGLGILTGLFNVLGFLVLMYELLRVGLFEIPVARLTFSVLSLATGIVGLITGIGMFALRPWARALSLVYGGLLILSSVFSFFTLPIMASIGTYDYDIGSIGASGLARLVIFGATYLVLPALYPLLLCVVFFSPAWKITFAKGRTA
jgi:hypothetical protein